MRPKVGFWAAARSVPTVMMMKPASSPRAAAPHRPKVGFWAAARSVPTVMMMKPASSPRAAAGNRYLELFSPRAA